MAQKKIIGIFNLIICNFSYHSKGFLETSQLAVLLLISIDFQLDWQDSLKLIHNGYFLPPV